MEKHINLFNNHTDYQNYINSSGFVTPNVSFCKNDNVVHYNPKNVITYKASAKLSEVTSGSGLHTNAFNTSIVFHTFDNGNGKIVFANDVTSIGEHAFYQCSGLTTVEIPNSATSIGEGAFYYCSGLTSITIPNNVTSIGNGAFNNCRRLTTITIPNSVTSIVGGAFGYCLGLTSVTIGNGVTSIGASAFANCSGLTSIICLSTSAPTISDNTFRSIKTDGTLYVPSGSTGYNVWMGTGDYYLGKYNWTKIEQ